MLRTPYRPTRRRILATLLAAPAPGWAAAAGGVPAAVPAAPLFEGLAGHTHAIESRHALVRRYFDQAVLLVYGFNPAEAQRSLEAAVAIDPACASAWWALAWAMGPNINADMAPQQAPRVLEALRQARRHAQRASPQRQALIAALSLRHPGAGSLDEEAYAERMQALSERYPRDADIALLAAEAVMNLHPYDWWSAAGDPLAWTPGIEALLQRALSLQPGHPGAHHYWIHLQESSARPARARASADALRTAFPGSGHLLHMPSHIDMRVGRYADAIKANQRSIEADIRYLQQVDAQGAYRVGYVAHNHHFLWAAASMAGQQQLALDAAQAAWPAACGPSARDPGLAITSHYAVLPFFARVRFGLWEALLHDTAPPDAPGPYALAIWHYARGTAHARLGLSPGQAAAQRELGELQRLAADPAVAAARVKNINPAAMVLRIAVLTLRADLALAAGRPQDAVPLLREATAVEDGMQYDEPHLWLAPTRHALGAALLAQGQAAQAAQVSRGLAEQAAQVYQQDLAHYPENGWSLTGLSRALAATGQPGAAEAMRQRARQAFGGAERLPSSSRF